MQNNINIQQGMDIHLFIEYSIKDCTVFGNIVHAEFGKTFFTSEFNDISVWRIKAVQAIINQLANSCVNTSVRMSVTIYNTEYLQVQSLTSNLDKLCTCINEETFYYQGKGQIKIDDDFTAMVPYHNIELQVLKARKTHPENRQIAIILAHSFVTKSNENIFGDDYIQQYLHCVGKNIEIVSLGMKDPRAVYRNPLNESLLCNFSTIPEWFRVAEYEGILFYLSILGKKLSEINKMQDDKKISELIKSYPELSLKEEENQYKNLLKRKQQEKLKRKKRKNLIAVGVMLSSIVGLGLLFFKSEYGFKVALISIILHFLCGKNSEKKSLSRVGMIIDIVDIMLFVFYFCNL